jgi:energy-coupling factor transporter ATP-binding protein EcfA2
MREPEQIARAAIDDLLRAAGWQVCGVTVGANGIGKSTLLSAINFCFTGIVSDPNRAFESMEEYYKFPRSYSSSYFRGRIVATRTTPKSASG